MESSFCRILKKGFSFFKEQASFSTESSLFLTVLLFSNTFLLKKQSSFMMESWTPIELARLFNSKELASKFFV
jgi:hypothetical protein